MSELEELIAESARLEKSAAAIQADTEIAASNEQIEQLVNDYQKWFARCVAVLPEELTPSFRKEYSGTFFSPKIKSFLEDPTKVSVIYQVADKEANASPIFSHWQNPYETTFRGPLLSQRQILLEAVAQRQQSRTTPDVERLLERLCRRFPDFLTPLVRRQRGRDGFAVADEYDLQDLFQGLLLLFFDDVRAEERTPSRAGASSTIDFLLKAERAVVETKMARPRLGAKELGEEIVIDIERYRAHPDVRSLTVFVYDPQKFVRNPRGLENDLNRADTDLQVRVYIVQT